MKQNFCHKSLWHIILSQFKLLHSVFQINPKFLLDMTFHQIVCKIVIFFDVNYRIKVLKLLQYFFLLLAYTTENKNLLLHFILETNFGDFRSLLRVSEIEFYSPQT